MERLSGKYGVWEDALNAARGGGKIGQGLIVGGSRENERLWRDGVQSVSDLIIRHTA